MVRQFNAQSVWKFILIVCIFSFFIFSCTEDESIENLGEPELLELRLLDYPEKDFFISRDSIPEIVFHSGFLPIEITTEKLRFSISGSNFEKLEVTDQLAFKPISSDTFSIKYSPSFLIKMISARGTEKIYHVKLLVEGPKIEHFNVELNQFSSAPLTGKIKVESDQEVTITYIIEGQDGADFKRSNKTYDFSHEIDLFGLYPDFTNRVTIVVTNKAGSVSLKEVYITTKPVPENLPKFEEMTLHKVDPQNSQVEFILLFPVRTSGLVQVPSVPNFPIVIDKFGRIRWYAEFPLESSTIMKRARNGNWLLASINSILEIDLMGNTYREIILPVEYHHDFEELPDGSIIYLANNISVNGTVEDKVYRIDTNGAILQSINFYNILDPSRPWLPNHNNTSDWLHSNSIYYVESDNSIVMSNRHQSTVSKYNLGSNSLQWILSDHTHWNSSFSDFLLTPTGTNFEFAYGQHSAIVSPYNSNSILVFDNGNFRSYDAPLSPANSYSRLVEYRIDESSKEVVQNFAFGKQFGSELYAPYVGNVQYVSSNSFFACFGGIYKDATGNAMNILELDGTVNVQTGSNEVRLMEFDRSNKVLFDLSIKSLEAFPGGLRSYRAYPFKF